MKLKIKYLLIMFVRIILSVFKIIPINKRKIVFSSFGGLRKSCNPLYIFYEFQMRLPVLDYYWVLNQETKTADRNCIKYGTIKYIYHMLTAGCVITNDTLPSYIPFRNRQLVINTWHGGGLFKQTYGNCTHEENEYNRKVNNLHNKDTKLFTLSSDAWYSQVVKNRFGYTGNILKCGMPRNDIFFMDDVDALKKKVKKYFDIPEGDLVVLYAPTFRGQSDCTNGSVFKERPIAIKEIVQKLSDLYGKQFHFIFRGHHAMKNSQMNCIDASSYPDMQELLLSADVFISDYSSCLWDFSLTKRPTFIYAPDFDIYVEKPGFESDYNGWPFIIARNNDELLSKIGSFDLDKYVNDVNVYLQNYVSYETGTASKQIVDYIIKFNQI